MMPPIPKAGAILMPKATTVAGATRQTSRILSATVATGALYMFRASKCTGAHTPCMATGETICTRLRTHRIMAPLLEMPFASILGRVNDEKIVIRSRDRNSPYDAKGMAFLPAPLPRTFWRMRHL